MKKMMVGVVIGLALSAGVASSRAANGDDAVIRETKDRTEIEALMWRYTRALDTSNADVYASVYTTDGQFGAGANATKGRDALRKMVADLRDRRAAAEAKGQKSPQLYHASGNHFIEFVDKDHARFHAYYMTMSAANGPETPARVAAVGREVSDLVRTNGQWLIKVRDVQPKD